MGWTGQRYLQIKAFIGDKSLNRANIVDGGHLFGKKFKQAKILTEHGCDDQIKLAGNHTDGND